MIKSNLDRLLEQHQLSAEKLHEETSLSKATIRHLLSQEANHIDFDELEALCDFFKCNVGDVLEHTSP